MHARMLALHNWERFRGEHTLHLEPKPYAVVARHVADPEHSNWMGKSSLVRAVRFALYGWHDHRLEDGWVTRGERRGVVRLQLNTGALIHRERHVGKRTMVQFIDENKVMSHGDKADAAIAAYVGLSRADFEATVYFGQGEMASHVKMKPEPRMEAVAEWVQLGRLEAAEAHAAGEVGTRSGELAKLRAELQAVEVAMPKEGEAEALVEELRKAERELAREETLLRGAQVQMARARSHRAALARAEEYARLDVEAAAQRKDLVGESQLVVMRSGLAELRRLADEAIAGHQQASREASQKRVLAAGAFDGTCPVAGIECPAKEVINKRRRENTNLYQNAVADEDAAAKLRSSCVRDHDQKDAELQEHDRRQQRYDDLVARRDKIAPVVELEGNWPGVDEEKAIQAQARHQQRVVQLTAEVERMGQQLACQSRLEADRRRLRDGILAVEAAVAPFREAAAILGRQGAQRRVAEGALAAIERGANERLDRCGISLGVKVRWEQEGSGLAKACGACGMAFPASARVKACARCGAVRGPSTRQKLEYDLTDRSGAADDLVGIAIRLSASEWLRRQRGAPWAAACIDEPMGQVDASIRRSLGRGLAAMLTEDFEQAFVIAHHASTLDVLPGRIEVVGDDVSSSVRVVS